MTQAPPPASYEEFLAVWDIIAPIGGAVPRDDDTKAGLWKKIAEDTSRMWTAPGAVVLVSLDRIVGSGRLEASAWFSSGDRNGVAGLLRKIEAWAASIGCEGMVLAGSPEWVAQFSDFKVSAVAGKKAIRR